MRTDPHREKASGHDSSGGRKTPLIVENRRQGGLNFFFFLLLRQISLCDTAHMAQYWLLYELIPGSAASMTGHLLLMKSTESAPHSPRQNHVLAALPPADYAHLLPNLELIPMPLGWALYESGSQMGYVYFPTTSIVSLLYVMESGATAEIAITGNCGLVGISLFMGGETTPSRAVVQSAGYGYRLKAG